MTYFSLVISLSVRFDIGSTTRTHRDGRSLPCAEFLKGYLPGELF